MLCRDANKIQFASFLFGDNRWALRGRFQDDSITHMSSGYVDARWCQPSSVDLRRKAKATADAEVADAKRRMNSADAQVVERLAHRLVNKLLHEPIVRLKAGTDPDANDTVAHVIRTLFALDETAIEPQ